MISVAGHRIMAFVAGSLDRLALTATLHCLTG
jgi:hypothetical protein